LDVRAPFVSSTAHSLADIFIPPACFRILHNVNLPGRPQINYTILGNWWPHFVGNQSSFSPYNGNTSAVAVALETGFRKDEHLARARNVKRPEKGFHDLPVGALKFHLPGNKFCLQMRDDIVRLRCGIIDRLKFVWIGLLSVAARNEDGGYDQGEKNSNSRFTH
jgi:hypothetical protein